MPAEGGAGRGDPAVVHSVIANRVNIFLPVTPRAVSKPVLVRGDTPTPCFFLTRLCLQVYFTMSFDFSGSVYSQEVWTALNLSCLSPLMLCGSVCNNPKSKPRPARQ